MRAVMEPCPALLLCPRWRVSPNWRGLPPICPAGQYGCKLCTSELYCALAVKCEYAPSVEGMEFGVHGVVVLNYTSS